MTRLALALLFAMLASAPPTSSALAHLGGGAFIIVPVDHVNPGQPFEVVAADMGANSTVQFRVEGDQQTAALGSATAAEDGHFTTFLTLPSDFPAGYAQLFARASDGSETSTWILVGPATASTQAPPGQAAWWSDPSVIVLGVLIAGGVGLVGYAVFRRRQPARVAAPAGTSRSAAMPGAAAGAAPTQRRSATAKAQRRAARRGHG